VTSAAVSAVTGKVLSASTVTGYAADWALFADWCTATNNTPLPADWATITAFTVGCPGAPATIRRRLAAIAHHHRTAGRPPPTNPAREAGPPPRELIGPAQFQMLMRLLPSHGWTAGVPCTGRRRGPSGAAADAAGAASWSCHCRSTGDGLKSAELESLGPCDQLVDAGFDVV